MLIDHSDSIVGFFSLCFDEKDSLEPASRFRGAPRMETGIAKSFQITTRQLLADVAKAEALIKTLALRILLVANHLLQGSFVHLL